MHVNHGVLTSIMCMLFKDSKWMRSPSFIVGVSFMPLACCLFNGSELIILEKFNFYKEPKFSQNTIFLELIKFLKIQFCKYIGFLIIENPTKYAIFKYNIFL